MPLRYLLAIPPLLFLGVFYFYPLISIFGLSFAPQGAWDTGKLYKLVANSYYLRVLWFTVWQAGLSTLLTLILALPGAYVFARYEFRGKALIQALITVPFVLPTVVTAAAFRALLGPGGLVNTGLTAAFDLSRPPINLDQRASSGSPLHPFRGIPNCLDRHALQGQPCEDSLPRAWRGFPHPAANPGHSAPIAGRINHPPEDGHRPVLVKKPSGVPGTCRHPGLELHIRSGVSHSLNTFSWPVRATQEQITCAWETGMPGRTYSGSGSLYQTRPCRK